ncbi:MAG: O-antigen ligase family protein [Sedimentisphaerales bacterium]|jgi:O-antigen ligase
MAANDIFEIDDIQQNDRIPGSIGFVFILLALAVSVASLPGFNYLVDVWGVLTMIVFIIASFLGGIKFAPEFFVFIIFILWGMIASVSAQYMELVITALFTLAQISMLILLLVNYSQNTKSVIVLLIAVLIGCGIVGVSGVLSGEYQRAEFVGERAAGITLNANSFAITLLMASAICLFFFRIWKSIFIKAGLVVLILGCAKLILSSGSRKGFIGFLLLLGLWFIFSYRKQIFKKPLQFVIGSIAVITIAGLFYTWSHGSITMQRFEKQDFAKDTRMSLYRAGFVIIAKHPVFGVGLNHYRIVSGEELYSHSNYIELMSTTGIPGAIIYYSIYLILWLRLSRLGKLDLPDRDKELVNLGKILLLLQAPLDLVGVFYLSKLTWIFFAIFIGWSNCKYKSLRTQEEIAQEQALADQSSQEQEIGYPL